MIGSTKAPSALDRTLRATSLHLSSINLKDGFLKTFLNDSKNLSFAECGELLMNSSDISTTHKELAQEGQTEV